MKTFKLVIAGGGSTYTPGIVKSLLVQKDRFKLNELVLYDNNAERQEAVGVIVRHVVEMFDPELKLTLTTDPEVAMTDADFIFAQMRVGLYAMREQDEKIPLKYGVVAGCFWFLYNKTRHGKYMYAIGGNEAAAEVAGVNVNATKIRIYILASCMFGLAGCLLAAKSGGASVNTAQGYELDAIAACTIGGVSTTGGVGTVPGVLVGVLVFELMKVALQFMNVNSSYTYIVQGLVIIVAVAIDIRKYLAKK